MSLRHYNSGVLPSGVRCAAVLVLGLAALPPGARRVLAQTVPEAIQQSPRQQSSRIDTLELAPDKATKLKQLLDAKDYVEAEKLLLGEIDRQPHSPRAARLLAFAGGVYFLNRDYFNAAVAWKKSDAITPLEPALRFSLAMAYIRMGHSNWAKDVLELLATQNPKEPLYPYWLGRISYDAQQYQQAIALFQQAIELDPRMARAYDNLGLCYFYLNQNALAVENYKKAIDLDRTSQKPSAWPYLDLAITLEFLNQTQEAEKDLREAIRLDPQLAQAHLQLGNILEREGRNSEAVSELREAAHLDPDYAEPHVALARIYRKTGQISLSQEEVNTYVRLRDKASASSPRSEREMAP